MSNTLSGESSKQKPVIHLAYLDSVRGIAAMIVVIYHFINWEYSHLQVVKAANFLFNGADAVAFFFVLSGFVLSYKYIVLNHTIDIGRFYINRFFRLWPAFFVTLLAIVLYLTWEHIDLRPQTLVDVFLFNNTGYFKEALLIRPVNYVYYVPGWTLTIEFIMSLFVPFAIIIAHNNAKAMWWLCGFLFFAATGVFKAQAVFINHFAYGVLAATYFTAISGEKFQLSKYYKYRYFIFMLGVLLFSLRPIEKMFGMPQLYDDIVVKYLGYELYDFSGVGAFVILVYILYSKKLQRVLNHNIPRFFGKISYGMYLMHWLVVMMIFNHYERLISYFPSEMAGFCILIVVYLLITVLLAIAVYWMVELPLIKLGKKLTANMRQTMQVQKSENV